MKKYLLILLTVFSFLNLGSTDKYEYKYQPDFAPFVYEGINDSIPTIDVFGRVRNGIIAQNIIDILNTDPSGVDLTEPEMAYVRSIVGGLYNTGMWQKSVALYGFVGGNEWKHKWNWKDMRDLDAAYRLQFFGTITHNSNGIQGDGGTGYANTFLIPSSVFTSNNIGFTLYCNSTSGFGVDIGSYGPNTILNRNFFRIRNQSGTPAYSDFLTGNATSMDYFGTNFIKNNTVFVANYVSTVFTLFSDGIKRTNDRTLGEQSNDFSKSNLFILAENQSPTPASFSNNRLALVAIHNSLTDKISISSSHVITYSQGILNRQ